METICTSQITIKKAAVSNFPKTQWSNVALIPLIPAASTILLLEHRGDLHMDKFFLNYQDHSKRFFLHYNLIKNDLVAVDDSKFLLPVLITHLNVHFLYRILSFLRFLYAAIWDSSINSAAVIQNPLMIFHVLQGFHRYTEQQKRLTQSGKNPVLETFRQISFSFFEQFRQIRNLAKQTYHHKKSGKFLCILKRWFLYGEVVLIVWLQ